MSNVTASREKTKESFVVVSSSFAAFDEEEEKDEERRTNCLIENPLPQQLFFTAKNFPFSEERSH